MSSKKYIESGPRKRSRPAKTAEERESQLISMAMNLAEEQLRSGTASPSVITHFLKAGSSRDQLEKAKIEKETEKIRAQQKSIESGDEVKEILNNAIEAFKSYSPNHGDQIID